MAGLSFAAIDVETANSARGSICAVGVTVVRDGKRGEVESWLCRPPVGLDFFNWHNIRVHGISAAMVADQPEFAQRWPEVVNLVGELPVIAHNAGFDSGAIREACGRSGIPVPGWSYSCSLALARRHLALDSYRLPQVAAALGIEFTNHHDAAADAAAAADIVIALAARTGADSLAALERMVVDRPLRVAAMEAAGRTTRDSARRTRTARPSEWSAGSSGWSARSSDRSASTGGPGSRSAPGMSADQPGKAAGDPRDPRRSWYGREELVLPTVIGTDPSHPLYGEIIVFTGDLAAMTRQQAWDAIAACGATPARNVTRRTTRLVIGDGFRGADAAAFTTTKARRVAELRMRGQRIEVMDEAGFVACLEARRGAERETSTAETARDVVNADTTRVGVSAESAQNVVTGGTSRDVVTGGTGRDVATAGTGCGSPHR
ncbi:exonuclease domain-containing protein [Nocardia sp. NPDC059764]|uniref:exonuclease domain-containing protein n=1 Tax=Nocardia sp. NPDC059764 TaxID=3346939 RepID=UPI00364847BC